MSEICIWQHVVSVVQILYHSSWHHLHQFFPMFTFYQRENRWQTFPSEKIPFWIRKPCSCCCTNICHDLLLILVVFDWFVIEEVEQIPLRCPHYAAYSNTSSCSYIWQILTVGKNYEIQYTTALLHMSCFSSNLLWNLNKNWVVFDSHFTDCRQLQIKNSVIAKKEKIFNFILFKCWQKYQRLISKNWKHN